MGTAPLIQFGVFGDAHCARGIVEGRHHGDSLVKLRDCIALFNRRKLALAFNMGDLIDRAPNEPVGTEGRHLATVLPVLSRYNGTWHHVIGNHDVAGMTKAEYMRQVGFKGATSFYSFDWGSVHCVVLDGNYNADGSDFSPAANDWTQAWMAPNELAWLRNDLARAGKRTVVVFTHENFDNRVDKGVLDPHLVRNTADVRNIIESAGNVKAVIQGHYHTGLHLRLGGIPYLGIAAVVMGPGPENNAFAIVSLNPDGSLAVEGFGRQESFIF